MIVNFEYKLEPTTKQASTLCEWLETGRKVWNYALAERKAWSQSRKCPVNACSLRSESIIPADQPYPTVRRLALTLASTTSWPSLRVNW